MKTWEVIKELTEDKSKVFKQATAAVPAKVFVNHLGLIEISHEDGKQMLPFPNENWEEVKQPYTFEEAYKMCSEEGVVFIDEYDELVLEKEDDKVWFNKNIKKLDDEEIVGVRLNQKWYKQ